jgi:DNA polymerase III epsilon subunit-like protein
MKVLIFDTETTGLPKNMRLLPTPMTLATNSWPHIVQFSHLLYDTETNEILSISDSIISVPEDVRIPPVASNIHGITNEISRTEGKDLRLVLDNFFQLLEKADFLVAHNFEFDQKVVIAEMYRLSYSEANIKRFCHWSRYYCTMDNGTNLCAIQKTTNFGKVYFKFPTLLELSKKLFPNEAPPVHLHNSMNDVIVCLRCYMMMYHERDIVQENKTIQAMIDQLSKERYSARLFAREFGNALPMATI